MVAAQGGDPRALDDTSLLPHASVTVAIASDREGFVAEVDALEVGRVVDELGAGRTRTDQGVDPRVGVRILRHRGDAVAPGDPLAEVHASSGAARDIAPRLRAAFSLSDEPARARPLIRARVDRAGITVFN
jgi:thymidine phosphorylase